MCLAVPRKIIKIDGSRALLQDKRWVRLDLVPGAKVDDFVIVSADLAVELVSQAQAEAMNETIS